MARLISALLPALAAAALLPPSASAAPTLGTPIDLSGSPGRIAEGPDGNIWVLISGSSANNEIAKITPAGVKTEYDVDELIGAVGLAAGPDGNLWATKTMAVVKVPPADPATATSTAIAGLAQAQDIVAGPEASLWAGSANDVFQIPAANPAGNTQLTDVLGASGSARGIAAGGDGRLWVADFGNDQVAAVTTAGVLTGFAVGPGLQGIAAGPANQIVATEPNAADTNLARVTPPGPLVKTKVAQSDPTGITFASDGAYWTAQFAMGQDSLGRFTPTGQYSVPFNLPANSGPRRIARGPGNTLWVSLETSKQVLPVRGVDPPPPGGGSTADTQRPVVSKLSLSRKRFAVGKRRTPVEARVKRGTTIRFTLSEPGAVSLRIERKLKGRRVGGRCRKATKHNRAKPPCTRYKSAGRLRRTGKQGANAVAFSGRIGRKALRPGGYRFAITSTDAAGNRSKAIRVSFRIVRLKKSAKGA